LGHLFFIPGDSKIKINVYNYKFSRGGATILLFRLIRELSARHEINVFVPAQPAISSLSMIEEFKKLPITITSSHIYSFAKSTPVLVNTILRSEAVIKFAENNIPVLWWIHEPEFGLEYIKRGMVDTEAFNVADRIVFPTQWQAQDLYHSYLKHKNWTVVPTGIGTDTSPQPCPFKKTTGHFYLLHLGTIEHRKGQDITINALRCLQNKNIKLLLVGRETQPYTEKIKDLIGSDNNVIFTGPQPETLVNAYIQHCDAMVLPTRDDLMPLALLEGLAFGKCILSSDFGPISETIRHGDTGLLSPIDDYHVLAENINLVYEDRKLLNRIGKNGNKIYKNKHNFSDHVERMEKEMEAINIL